MTIVLVLSVVVIIVVNNDTMLKGIVEWYDGR